MIINSKVKQWTKTNYLSLNYYNSIWILLYSSKPPFVYFFNPKLDVRTKFGTNKDGFKFIHIWFIDKEDVRI